MGLVKLDVGMWKNASRSISVTLNKWIKDIKIREGSLNLIEEEVGNSLEHIGSGDNFINRK